MEPDTVEVIDQLAADGCEALLMVPISFVSDHIETLHEIDIEYSEHAQSKGIRLFRRAPSLNDRPDFLQALADLVRDHLEKSG
jgi:ferrochelatase